MSIVITGANRGLGLGLAEAFRAKGHDVVGTSRAGRTEAILDVTDPASHEALAASLGETPVEMLICNAGVYLDKGQALETGYVADLWSQSFATNVTGVFLGIQALLPALRRARSSKICILSSQMASSELAPGGSYIYRASKAAVLNLGRNLATDLRSEGIAVGIYHPGWVQTDMGGAAADIGTDEAVAGLVTRFEALSLETTGCFETWDGRAHPM